MRPLIAKIKPASGFSRVVHVSFNVLLPLIVFVLVRIDFVQPALIIILLSKWRMLAVRPRFWPANIRANAVDIMVSVSLLLFMANTGSQAWQLVWAVAYGLWLIVIKPASTSFMISMQAMIGLLCGLMAVSAVWTNAPLYGLVVVVGLVCYISAHHFFDSFDEPYTRLLSYIWGYFGATLMWVLGHGLIFYPSKDGLVSQPTVILLTLGYGLAVLYYCDHSNKLNNLIRNQTLFVMIAVCLIMIGSLLISLRDLVV
jgi:hypothetical protein